MRAAWPAIRNVLKAWVLLLGLCAALGALGWWIGGLRVALVFVFGGLLVGLGSYWYADRIVAGNGRRARAALRRGAAAPDPGRAAVASGAGGEAAALRDSGRFPTGTLGRSRPGELVDRGQHGPPRHALAGRARGSRRARGRAHPQPGHAGPDDGGRARRLAGRVLPDRRLARTCAALRPRPGGGVVHPSAAVAEARARGRPAGGRNSANRRTASRTRSSGSTRRASWSSSRRARPPSRCTRQSRSPRKGWRGCS